MKSAKIIHRIARLYWKITRPTTVGVRILLIKEDEVLLVKHTYQDFWFLPGGGVKKYETVNDAIRRELAEEIGGVVNDLKIFNVYSNNYEGKNDYIILFVSDQFEYTNPGEGDREIEQIGMFSMDALPENISPGTSRRIQEYRSEEIIHGKQW